MKNVMSWVNAGKRHYGEDHWFWAVWVDAEDVSQYRNQEPTNHGFAKSQKLARREAIAAIKSCVADPKDLRACQRAWVRNYLENLQAEETRLPFSRFSVGKNRWFWVVVKDGEHDVRLAQGIADSADAAFQQAVQSVGPVVLVGNHHAKYTWAKERATARSRADVVEASS